MNILHLPYNDANVAWSQVRALKDLGEQADLLTVHKSPLVNDGNIDLSFYFHNSMYRNAQKWVFFLRDFRRYDIFHYHSARSLLDYKAGNFSLIDFRIASKFRPVFSTFHGCDIRDFQKGSCPIPCGNPVCRLVDRHKCFDEIVALSAVSYVTTPDLLRVNEKFKYMPQSVYGLDSITPLPPESSERTRIVHMPSSSSIKGTAFVLNACDLLKEEGLDFELVLVRDIPHPEALAILDTADIVIDQLLAGWYGVLAVEAAIRAKPVVVNLAKEYLSRVDIRPPFINACPDSLVDTLRKLIIEKHMLAKIGMDSREYVSEVHNALTHARILMQDYKSVCESDHV